MDFNTTFREVGITIRVVNELRDFGLTHFCGTITEYKKKGVDCVGFAGSIRTNNGREGLGIGSVLW
jgi:hypothetical protein